MNRRTSPSSRAQPSRHKAIDLARSRRPRRACVRHEIAELLRQVHAQHLLQHGGPLLECRDLDCNQLSTDLQWLARRV